MASTDFRRQWFLLIVALLILGSVVGWDLYTEYHAIDVQEHGRLTAQIKVFDENLELQLTATHHALNSIRSDLPKLKAQKDGMDGMAQINHRLQFMRNAMPTTRAISVFGADGTLIARSPNKFVGQNFSQRDYFKIARQGGNAATLYVTPPFLAATGDHVLNMSKVLHDEHGAFAGVILVSLGPEYFSTLLKSLLYAPDMRVTLVHGDGKVIFRIPDPQGITGTDLMAKPGTFFSQHMASGQQTSTFYGIAASTSEARLAILSTIRPAAIPMDKPLVISVSRELPALFAPWRDALFVHGGLSMLLALVSTLSLNFYQQRRRVHDRQVTDQEAERKRGADALRESEKQLSRAQQIAHTGSWNLDLSGNHLTWSDEVYRIFGCAPKEFTATYEAFLDFIHPDDRAGVNEAYVRSLQEGSDSYEFEHRVVRRKSGEVRYVHEHCIHERDAAGTIIRSTGTVQDITERKQAEVKLQGYRDHLEELVEERTHALNAARQQAEAANLAKSTFLSNMSHELRTPLNAVIGFSRLLARSTNLNGEEKKNLEIINNSGLHLLTLINDVLDLAKIDAGRVEFQEVEFEPALLAEEVIAMLKPRAEQTGLTLTLHAPARLDGVRSDPVKLRQILINLLGNAIKFTQTGSVSLSIQSPPTDAGRVRLDFAISDTGIGITAEDQAHIFEPFAQLVTHATSAGTGLGLTITRQYLAMLGSELVVDSVPGQGSTFRFSLDLPCVDDKVLPPVANGEVTGLARADRGKVILIAEDHPDARALLKALLEPLGFVVGEAADGEEAVAQVERVEGDAVPDLILMDWRMPKLDGLAALQRIRALPLVRQPKIVMLTAFAFEEQRQKALDAGADGYLRKPIDENALYQTLETQLGLRLERAGAVSPAPTFTADGAAAVTPEAIAALPDKLRAALRQAVEELNRTQLKQIVAEIAQTQPALAQGIDQRIDAFQYKELLTEISQGIPDHSADQDSA